MLGACASLEALLPVVEAPAIENQRAAFAMSSLHDLEEIDAYIKLDNTPLRKQISAGLEAQAELSGHFQFSRLKVRFARQFIALEAKLQIDNGSEEKLEASLHGDVVLTFSGTQSLSGCPALTVWTSAQQISVITGRLIR